MRNNVAAWMAGLGTIAAAALAGAADPPMGLEEAVAAARGAYAPLEDQRLAAAQKKLTQALDNLDRFISRAGPDISKRWRDYLKIDGLRAQLAAGATPDSKVIYDALEQFESGVVGMEVSAFRDTRYALQDYYHLLALSREEKLEERYGQELEALTASIAAYKTKPTAEDAQRIGRVAQWLERFGRGGAVVGAIRRDYLHPNLYARISGDLVSAGVEEPVDDFSHVHDVILGTRLHADAHTRGQLTGDLVPDPNRAVIDLQLTGNTWASSIGYNGPATIRSSSVTSINGRKRIYFDADGLRSDGARASAGTSSNIHSISAGCRIIEKIAWKRAGQQKGQAERIASSHAAGRVAGRMNARAVTQLAEATEKYEQKFRLPLLRRDAFPQTLAFQTTDEAISVTGLAAAGGQIAAPGAPPAIKGTHGLAVQAHQSAVNNLAESLLGHETLTDVRLAKLMEDLTGEVPEELKITEDKDPWSITFAADQPITIEVDDNQLTIAVRGVRFTRQDSEINKSMVITATYKIEKTPEGTKLVREGNVTADYTRKGVVPIGDKPFQTFMQRKFSALFKPEIETKGLTPKGRLAKVGTLKLAQLVADNGWLALAWDAEKSPAPATTATAGAE